MQRLLTVNNVPTPYRTFMFNLMHAKGLERDIEFSVVFQGRREAHRSWKPEDFDMRFPSFISTGLRGRGAPQHEIFRYSTLNRDIVRAVRSGAYDWVMMSPYSSLTGWIASSVRAGRTMRLLWSESNTDSTRRMHWAARWLKRRLQRRYDVLVCPGRRAVELLVRIRPEAARLPVLWLPNIVDNRVFVDSVRAMRERRPEVRRDLGIAPDRTLLLGIGQLVERKGFHRLIDAATEVAGTYEIAILGDGEQRSRLLARIAERGVGDRVRLLGPKPEAEVARYLSAADWFVHPATQDPSPLVVIEAASAGLPMAVSVQTGNCPEGVDEGINGFTFDPTRPGSLADCLRRMLECGAERRAELEAGSRRLSDERFEPSGVVDRFYRSLLEITARRSATV